MWTADFFRSDKLGSPVYLDDLHVKGCSVIDPTIIAKAVYFIEGDETASEYQSVVIQHNESLWLVATWLQSHAADKRYPERIVPMASLPHVVMPDGMTRLGLLMPRQLVSAECPPELLRKFCAEIHPAIVHIPGPSSIQ